jgi:hypothetical protein
MTGYDGVNYRLGASAGQTMQVLFSPRQQQLLLQRAAARF